MDVLVLGGSVFLGRAMVSEAIAAGHDVTVLNRGQSGTTPPGARQVTGDRTDPETFEALRGQHFDLVIDTCGYVPAVVDLSARALQDSAGHYAFVSSVNAYPGWPEAEDYRAGGAHDGDPDATEAPPGVVDAGAYGWLKVGCERAVERAFGAEHTTALRAGCIVGPDDSVTGRLPWWIDRVARGGEVLAPGSPRAQVALVDSRDLARFALLRAPGVFETPGPPARDTREDLMLACRTVTGSDAEFVWVADDWLAAQDVQAWTEVPLWIAEADGPSVFRHHPDEAVDAGLQWRPLTETVADTWAWMQTVEGGWCPGGRTPGLDAAREQSLINAWRNH